MGNSSDHFEQQLSCLCNITAELVNILDEEEENAEKTPYVKNIRNKIGQLRKQKDELSSLTEEYRKIDGHDFTKVVEMDNKVLDNCHFKNLPTPMTCEFVSRAIDFLGRNRRLILGSFMLLGGIALFATGAGGVLGIPAMIAGSQMIAAGAAAVGNKLYRKVTADESLLDKNLSAKTAKSQFLTSAKNMKTEIVEGRKGTEEETSLGDGANRRQNSYSELSRRHAR